MITIILSFIGRTPGAMSALLYTAMALLVANISLVVTVKIQGARLDAANARQEALGDKLTTQNRAVGQWKVEAAKQADKVKAAQKKAEKDRVVTVERVRTVAIAQVPPACPDAVKWGALHALEFNRHWEGLK